MLSGYQVLHSFIPCHLFHSVFFPAPNFLQTKHVPNLFKNLNKIQQQRYQDEIEWTIKFGVNVNIGLRTEIHVKQSHLNWIEAICISFLIGIVLEACFL